MSGHAFLLDRTNKGEVDTEKDEDEEGFRMDAVEGCISKSSASDRVAVSGGRSFVDVNVNAVDDGDG